MTKCLNWYIEEFLRGPEVVLTVIPPKERGTECVSGATHLLSTPSTVRPRWQTLSAAPDPLTLAAVI